MTDSPTRLLNQLLVLTDDPDDVQYAEQDGQAFIVLGTVSLALGPSSQAVLDKLATVTAQAAANNRGRNLREVA